MIKFSSSAYPGLTIAEADFRHEIEIDVNAQSAAALRWPATYSPLVRRGTATILRSRPLGRAKTRDAHPPAALRRGRLQSRQSRRRARRRRRLRSLAAVGRQRRQARIGGMPAWPTRAPPQGQPGGVGSACGRRELPKIVLGDASISTLRLPSRLCNDGTSSATKSISACDWPPSHRAVPSRSRSPPIGFRGIRRVHRHGRNEAIPVRHFDLRQAVGVHDLGLLDDAVPIEQKRDQRVDFVHG